MRAVTRATTTGARATTRATTTGARATTRATTTGARAGTSSTSTSAAASALFERVDASRRGVGLAANDDARREIERAIDALAAAATRARDDGATTNNAKSYARWELAYATEKETLWLLGLKTRSTTRAFQTLREDAKTLSNEVVFDDGTVIFRVDAAVEETSETRMTFRFTAASLTFKDKWTIPIPPVGSGWFENVYVDDARRVSRDSRGDTLICVKVA